MRMPVKKMRFEAGFTLMEIMVALLLGSVLMIAVYQNFIAAQRTYTLVQGQGDIQENARFSLEIIKHAVRQAGYRANTLQTAAAAFPVAGGAGGQTNPAFPAVSQVLTGTNDVVAGANVLPATDSLSVRYQGDGTLTTDCLGTVIPGGVTAVNTFYVRDDQSLHCWTSLGAGSDQPIVDGVDDMQVLYGVDTDADLLANRYVNAAGVAAADWPNVVSVRISLLFNSITPVPGATSQTLTLLDAAPKPFTDGLKRQIFTTTIGLRNRVR